MKKLTPELIEKLKQKALAATPGPWWQEGPLSPEETGTPGGLPAAVIHVEDCEDGETERTVITEYVSEKDAAFIAAADPETVMALIGALEVERAAVEVLAEIAERCQADSRGCEFCYVRGGCDPDNMAKCARAEARKRLGLGEEGGDAGWSVS